VVRKAERNVLYLIFFTVFRFLQRLIDGISGVNTERESYGNLTENILYFLLKYTSVSCDTPTFF
jgi:hypothetical protein